MPPAKFDAKPDYHIRIGPFTHQDLNIGNGDYELAAPVSIFLFITDNNIMISLSGRLHGMPVYDHKGLGLLKETLEHELTKISHGKGTEYIAVQGMPSDIIQLLLSDQVTITRGR